MIPRTSMFSLTVLIGVAACAPSGTTMAGATQADSAAIDALRQQAEAAVNAGDTTLAYFSDDVVAPLQDRVYRLAEHRGSLQGWEPR